MKDVWDRLAVSKPINTTAGVVASQSRGQQPVGPAEAPHHWSSDVPITTIAVRGNQENLAGISFGRFVVVGYLGRIGGEGKWLVRCACGTFERRSARAIRNPANNFDRCRTCAHTDHLRHRYNGLTGQIISGGSRS